MIVDKLELIIQNDCLKRDLEYETAWRTVWKQAAKKWFHMRGLLRRCNEFLKHAPEFPLGLLAEAEELQSELAKELRDE